MSKTGVGSITAEMHDAAGRTSLELLAVNRQIYAEAAGIFYAKNSLTFASCNDVCGFLRSLTFFRLAHLREITVFYQYLGHRTKEALALLRMLPHLRKLHVLVFSTELQLRHAIAFQIADAEALFHIRNCPDIKVRNTSVEDAISGHSEDGKILAEPHKHRNQAKRLAQALRHFNRGLALAQKGVVFTSMWEWYDWNTRPAFPAIEGSTCSMAKGCDCPEGRA